LTHRARKKEIAVAQSALSAVRAALKAYVDKDRAAIEALIADDYHFSSPLDNRLNRATYFARCWPNSETTDAFEEVHANEDGAVAFIVYVGSAGGRRFQNCEVHTVRDGKLIETEVYFGWDVPHKAPKGGFTDNPSDSEQ
jgi:ketosteroid isomerase-like protein